MHQDQLLADLIRKFGKPIFILANKMDLLAVDERRKASRGIRKSLVFLGKAPIKLISANKENFNTEPIIDKALMLYDQAANRFAARVITKVLHNAVQANEPPRRFGKRPALRYAHQAGVNPPVFVVHGRHVRLIQAPYVRYLANQFAQNLDYEEVPIQVRFKESAS